MGRVSPCQPLRVCVEGGADNCGRGLGWQVACVDSGTRLGRLLAWIRVIWAVACVGSGGRGAEWLLLWRI